MKFALVASLLLCSVSGCGVPNLESAECREARDAVKRFYSFHFANEMRPSAAGFDARRPFLTDSLSNRLTGRSSEAEDYFTATENYPRTFRVGECQVTGADSALLNVLLLWRDDTSSDQKEISVRTHRAGDKWLIDEVTLPAEAR